MSNSSLHTQNSLQIVDSIPGLVWSTDADGGIDFLNQQSSEYTGLGLFEAQGRHWIDARVIHSDDLSKLSDSWQGILTTGQPGEAEARMKRFDGEYHWFLFRVVPLRDDLGTIVQCTERA